MMRFVDEIPSVRIGEVAGQRRKGRKRARVALSAEQMARWMLDDDGELTGALGTRYEGKRLGVETRLPNGETQRVRLVATPCRYGGVRLWFACPVCGRRVDVLYCVGSLACRKCHGLYYRCEAENPRRRSLISVAVAVLDMERREERIRDYFAARYTPKAAARRILRTVRRLAFTDAATIAEFRACCAKERGIR